jgi:hypothetical protein
MLDALSKSRIDQIEAVRPLAIAEVTLAAEFTRTKLYHATHKAKQALRFSSSLLNALYLERIFPDASACVP